MSLQIVELHFHTPPDIDFEAIRRRTEEILGSEVDMPSSAEGQTQLFAHKRHTVEFVDKSMPALTALLQLDQRIELDKYADDIQQSWMCRDAESLLEGAAHSLLVTEMMTQGLEPQVRATLFHGVLQGAVECTEPAALVFKHSQQVVLPQDYLDALDRPVIQRPGSLNVRFFNISNTPGDMLMDTRGMDAMGMTDVQCHFRDLDPNDVSAVLYNTAVYLFESGPVIEPGNTVAGVGDDSRWECQFEHSLLEPKREVIDLNPGEPYAAGQRE